MPGTDGEKRGGHPQQDCSPGHHRHGTDTQLDALLEKLAEEGKDSSFISLYYGEDVTEDAAQAAGARFQAVCPDAEISVLSGGQPVYYYIISFE